MSPPGRYAVVIAALVAMSASGCTNSADSPTAEITVFAAASPAEDLHAVGAAVRSGQSGNRRGVQLRGSSDLVAQLQQGAPVICSRRPTPPPWTRPWMMH